MREIDGKNWKCVTQRVGVIIHLEKTKLHKKVGIIKKNGFNEPTAKKSWKCAFRHFLRKKFI